MLKGRPHHRHKPRRQQLAQTSFARPVDSPARPARVFAAPAELPSQPRSADGFSRGSNHFVFLTRELRRHKPRHEEMKEVIWAGLEANLRVWSGANVLRTGPSHRTDRSRESLLIHSDVHRLHGAKRRLNHIGDGHWVE